jgi:hypothetical protein
MGIVRQFFSWSLVAVVVAACASAQQPVTNFSGVPLGAKSPPSLDQVGKAIRQAGAAAGWQMSDLKPGHILGVYKIRSHTAIVDVTYSTSTYDIKFREGDPGLRYDAAAGTIHEQYNKWVGELEKVIRAHANSL